MMGNFSFILVAVADVVVDPVVCRESKTGGIPGGATGVNRDDPAVLQRPSSQATQHGAVGASGSARPGDQLLLFPRRHPPMLLRRTPPGTARSPAMDDGHVSVVVVVGGGGRNCGEEELSGEEDKVMSEVHLGCPPASSRTSPHFSNFVVSLPSGDCFKEEAEVQEQKQVTLDEDGDLVVVRRNKVSTCRLAGDGDLFSHCFNVIIKHCIKSSILAVGLQVWKAELALSDFVLHSMYTSSMFDEVISIELSAGTGLVGMLVARAAKTVFLTDCGDKVLDNCYENVQLNFGTLKYKSKVFAGELDWLKHWPPKVDKRCPNSLDRYYWTSSEVEEAEDASILLAADVIYIDDLTDALFSTLERLMSRVSEKIVYATVEHHSLVSWASALTSPKFHNTG